MPAHPLRRGLWLRWIRLGSLMLVLTAALGGLAYVGLGEAYRGYARLQFERLAAQGAIIKGPVEMLLRVGVSLEQFTGFPNLARAMRDADPSLEEIRIIDARGHLLFSEPVARLSQEAGGAPASRARFASPNRRFDVLDDGRSFRVSIPLEDRFHVVGHLELVSPRAAVFQRVTQRFQPIFTALGACILLLAIVLFATQRIWMRRARLWLGLCCGAGFLGMTLVMLLALVDIYSEGLQQGTSGLAHSLARRLNEAARIGLTRSDLRGLDTLLEDYQRSNADLGSLSLIADERVLIQTGASAASPLQEPTQARFEYAIDLELTDGPWNTPVRLEVDAATGALRGRLWRSCRNFLLLFIASGLLGALLLNALALLPRPGVRQQGFERRAVDRLRPLAFFGCFIEGLPLAFLPGYIGALGAQQGHSSGGPPLLAIAFCLSYAFALWPCELYARRMGLKRLLGAALLLSAIPVFSMALTEDLRLLLLLRCLSGLGQGALAGGLQAYLLAVFRPEHPPRGTSLLTSAHHGGLFSGAALGALLGAYLGPRQVFLLSGLAGLLALAYALVLLPPLPPRSRPTPPVLRRSRPPSSLSGLARAWKAPGFHGATLLVGIPTLLIRSGLLSFALPLVLTRRGYDLDRIGQLLAIYALGVMLSHHLLTVLPSGPGRPRRLLQAGMAGTGLGLLALGFVDSLPALGSWLSEEALCALALGLLGLSHGLIHAPLERHLTRSQEGGGEERTSLALHRFISRLGQCLGPMLVSALLLIYPNRFQAFGWLGVMALLLGAGFTWASRRLHGHEVHHA
ncbi:MAG: MFS transporter [Hyalangium sp.]|uniref:MFS transporter n=1 Tax=Hyalangium sp. TaxID=2028555 RepID=UPI00389AC53F